MLSIEQLTILSYITDGSVLCRKCGEDAGLPTKDAVCAYSTYEFAGSEGLTCDDCGKEIVEAYTWTCPDCDKIYYGEEASSVENDHDETGCGDEDCKGEEDSE